MPKIPDKEATTNEKTMCEQFKQAVHVTIAESNTHLMPQNSMFAKQLRVDCGK
jgi:hypothetical protein